MNLLELLINRYESSEEMSVDRVLQDILYNNPDYASLSKEEIIEIQRNFVDYVQSANEDRQYMERWEKGYLNDTEVVRPEARLNSYRPHDRRIAHKQYVEAFIDNISVPRTVEELEKDCMNGNDAQKLLKDLAMTGTTNWTAPRWAKRGDIVLFMHAKMARTHLTRIRTEIRSTYPEGSPKRIKLLHAIEDQIAFHKQYGGKIYVIGRVSDKPQKQDTDLGKHFSSNIFCDIDDLYYLKRPIDISEFNSFITLNSMSAITPVYNVEYDQLKELIAKYNDVPEYFKYSYSTPFPHNRVNSENWIRLGLEYRHSFSLEIQFRQCYVNYLLQELGGQKKLYRECTCIKGTNPHTFVDNVVRINGKWLPVEVKLNINAESDLPGQCTQYCMLDHLILDNKTKREAQIDRVIRDKVLVIDTFAAYMFDYNTKKINLIYDLMRLRSHEDITELKSLIIKEIDNI